MHRDSTIGVTCREKLGTVAGQLATVVPGQGVGSSVAPSVPVPPKFWPTAGRGEPCSAPLRVSTVPYVNERYENGLRLVCFGGNLTSLNDGAAVAGAKPFADVFLGAPSHPAPLTRQTYHETAAGSYSIGPIWFDAPGKWTTRFHFFPDYCDEPASPHGHAAFYVYVP